jgi:nitroimidazol reductase NimA-like FMN-containing flavoprotein (pyridoxamine 5'-phosphate oxidase superfamily)
MERHSSDPLEKDIVPPFPDEILSVVSRVRLSYLATASCNEPHISLMCFTFIPADEEFGHVFVFTTSKNTLKYEYAQRNGSVAILLHDFNAEGQGGTQSITAYGTLSFPEPAAAERLRAIHLSRNPSYSQFITGKDVQVVCVCPRVFRTCSLDNKKSTFPL